MSALTTSSRTVGVAKCFQSPPSTLDEEMRSTRAGASGPWFPRDENGVYFENAHFSFTFPCGGSEKEKEKKRAKQEKDGRGQELRAVFVLTKEAFKKVAPALEK